MQATENLQKCKILISGKKAPPGRFAFANFQITPKSKVARTLRLRCQCWSRCALNHCNSNSIPFRPAIYVIPAFLKSLNAQPQKPKSCTDSENATNRALYSYLWPTCKVFLLNSPSPLDRRKEARTRGSRATRRRFYPRGRPHRPATPRREDPPRADCFGRRQTRSKVWRIVSCDWHDCWARHTAKHIMRPKLHQQGTS